MKIIADTHVHTIASEHAFSTVLENHAAANEHGEKHPNVAECGEKSARGCDRSLSRCCPFLKKIK